jgi:alkylation response protein AidB-like acyl-CoA dehydrogenase
MAAQFLAGYHDLDLRDATGLGHGALIARHAGPAAAEYWLPRLTAGDLAGVAITEAHGGSVPAAAQTCAEPGPNGTWLITGAKTWISRLNEAAVFTVFFRDPTGQLAAGLIDASEPGLHRRPLQPVGLSGWAWGILDLDHVPIHPSNLLDGEGMALLREHFAAYRPLVTATALGAAAAVFDTVAARLRDRCAAGEIACPRDTALVTLGRTHAQLIAALLGALAAAGLAERGHEGAERFSAAMKAHGVDVAYQAVTELALLAGADAYRAESPIAKTRRDLGGLLYADGIHDSLYRTAGKHHAHPTDIAAPATIIEVLAPAA